MGLDVNPGVKRVFLQTAHDDGGGEVDLTDPSVNPIGVVSKALLVASESDLGAWAFPDFQLTLLDAKGQTVFSLGTSGGEYEEAASGDKRPDPDVRTLSRILVTYSPASEAMLSLVKGTRRPPYHFRPPQEIKEALYAPELYDPLSYMQSDELLALAASLGKPIVADVPDDVPSAAVQVGFKDSTVNKVMQVLDSGETLSRMADDRFLVIKPAHPVDSRMNRANRSSLAALLKAGGAQLVPRLDDFAAYAGVNSYASSFGAVQPYLASLVPALYDPVEDPSE